MFISKFHATGWIFWVFVCHWVWFIAEFISAKYHVTIYSDQKWVTQITLPNYNPVLSPAKMFLFCVERLFFSSNLGRKCSRNPNRKILIMSLSSFIFFFHLILFEVRLIFSFFQSLLLHTLNRKKLMISPRIEIGPRKLRSSKVMTSFDSWFTTS